MTASTQSSADGNIADSNGRVTLALLALKLDYLIEQVRVMCNDYKIQQARIADLERNALAQSDELKRIALAQSDERKRVRRVQGWAGGIAAAVIAGVIIAAIIYWTGWQ